MVVGTDKVEGPATMPGPIRHRPFLQPPGPYITALINQPWVRDGLHCWRLVCNVQRDLFAVELPAVLREAPIGLVGQVVQEALSDHLQEYSQWLQVPQPVNGAIALMRMRGTPPKLYTHAGVYLAVDDCGVLHVSEPYGVTFDTVPQLTIVRGWQPDYFVRMDR